MITHIFSDMDGTLLTADGKVSAKTAAALTAYPAAVTLVSARAPMEMQAAIDALGLTDCQIAFNGGLIFQPTPGGNQVLQARPMNLPVVESLLLNLPERFAQVSFSAYSEAAWVAEKIDEGIVFERRLTGLTPTLMPWHKWLASEPQVFKLMMITFDDAAMGELHAYFTELNEPSISVQQSGQHYLEITSKAAKKSTGIAYVFEKDQLKRAQTAAFGDGHNDLPMFASVGYPVAMANAVEAVKQAAKATTLANTEDGIAHALANFDVFSHGVMR